jgi:hypothetical protein
VTLDAHVAVVRPLADAVRLHIFRLEDGRWPREESNLRTRIRSLQSHPGPGWAESGKWL